MSDYFEIDFLDVETKKSGDAIALRYSLGGQTFVHVVDGGFLDTGVELANHIRRYFGNGVVIDNVVVTHPDGDHAAGLQTILEEFDVGALWMLRPWGRLRSICRVDPAGHQPVPGSSPWLQAERFDRALGPLARSTQVWTVSARQHLHGHYQFSQSGRGSPPEVGGAGNDPSRRPSLHH
jgi:phosphoribosyl 1,2-cyclic phosphodiesterase